MIYQKSNFTFTKPGLSYSKSRFLCSKTRIIIFKTQIFHVVKPGFFILEIRIIKIQIIKTQIITKTVKELFLKSGFGFSKTRIWILKSEFGFYNKYEFGF